MINVLDGDYMFFQYGKQEISHLKQNDKKLGDAISQIGMIQRRTEPDLFSSIIRHIVGQQISKAAQETVWQRMCEFLGGITPESIEKVSINELQAKGITFKKAGYIKGFAEKVLNKEFDIDSLYTKGDEEVIKYLTTLKGIGVWTAEMVLIFCMQRPDVVSFGDLGIRRGMQILYDHEKIDRKLFENYRKRYSPYGTTASLYLWEIAAGRDYKVKNDTSGEKI